jgi:predicted RNA-binding protein YlqC (UPF0109 family)
MISDSKNGGKSRINKEVMEELRAFVSNMVCGIVDNPAEVEVIIVPASCRIVMELHTGAKDVGQVVGKNGYVVASIRSLVAAFGGKNGLKIDLDFITEKNNAQTRRRADGGNR